MTRVKTTIVTTFTVSETPQDEWVPKEELGRHPVRLRADDLPARVQVGSRIMTPGEAEEYAAHILSAAHAARKQRAPVA